jgi:hypothetical protein
MVTKYGILDSRDLAQQFEQWKQNYVPYSKPDLPAQPTAPSP